MEKQKVLIVDKMNKVLEINQLNINQFADIMEDSYQKWYLVFKKGGDFRAFDNIPKILEHFPNLNLYWLFGKDDNPINTAEELKKENTDLKESISTLKADLATLQEQQKILFSQLKK